MWVCLNNGFVSIVEDWDNPEYVYVRGRRRSDVLAFVRDPNEYNIRQTDRNDYRFRAKVSKKDLGELLVEASKNIKYTNFKASVKDKTLEAFYAEVWISGLRNLDPGWYDRNIMDQLNDIK